MVGASTGGRASMGGGASISGASIAGASMNPSSPPSQAATASTNNSHSRRQRTNNQDDGRRPGVQSSAIPAGMDQSGLIVWRVNSAQAEAASMALGADAVVVFGSGSPWGPLTAVSYDLAYDPVAPGDTVETGETDAQPGHVTRAVVHPDDAVDVTLLELEGDLVEPTEVRFGGFADPRTLGQDARVACYGAGRNKADNTGFTGELRRGFMIFEGLDPTQGSPLLTLTSICEKGPETCDAVLQGGDSGTACFVRDDTETWLQLGVYRGSRNTRPDLKGYLPGYLTHQMTRGDVIAAWVAHETAL